MVRPKKNSGARSCPSNLAPAMERNMTTIMDKSLGTNLHLWRVFTRAKQIHLHLFIPSPSAPSYNVGHVYTLFLQSFNIVLGEEGEATHFKTDNSAF